MLEEQRTQGTPDAAPRAIQRDLEFLRTHLPTLGYTGLDTLTLPSNPPRSPRHRRADLVQQPSSSRVTSGGLTHQWTSSSQAGNEGGSQPLVSSTDSMRGAAAAVPGGEAVLEEALDECVESYADELGLSERQAATVRRARGPAKVHKLAGMVQVGAGVDGLLTVRFSYECQ